MKKFLAFSLSDVVFIMLINVNVKMPAIVGIFTFMRRINFVLSGVEHEKSFIISGPDFSHIVALYNVTIHYSPKKVNNALFVFQWWTFSTG